VKIAHRPEEVERVPRAVAVGSFDGIHRGHRAVLAAARETGLAATVITFDPHPRIALGNRVELLTTLARRLELIEEAGVETSLVAAFTPEFQRLEPEAFAERYLHGIGAEAIVAGEDFRFGIRRSGDLRLLERLGYEIVVPDEVEGVSSTAIRAALAEGDVVGAAGMLGRPFELDGTVVAGHQRGGTLGFPTANLLLEPDLACPRFGIYAGAARLGSDPGQAPTGRDAALPPGRTGHGRGLTPGVHRAAVSIGTNPHYGGTERRIEPYLLEFEGDLYGERLVVELWERLRDEAAFESEEALVAQIGADVEAARRSRRPPHDR
jgi:riboflavin kinase/FMN adenylyltransferase